MYVGDSVNLPFLQNIRRLVKSSIGDCVLTTTLFWSRAGRQRTFLRMERLVSNPSPSLVLRKRKSLPSNIWLLPAEFSICSIPSTLRNICRRGPATRLKKRTSPVESTTYYSRFLCPISSDCLIMFRSCIGRIKSASFSPRLCYRSPAQFLRNRNGIA
jgi:hypothetical protein